MGPRPSDLLYFFFPWNYVLPRIRNVRLPFVRTARPNKRQGCKTAFSGKSRRMKKYFKGKEEAEIIVSKV